MATKAEKSRPKKLLVDAAVMTGIEKHSISNLEAEVGGMLFGEIVDGLTKIVGFVPATTAKAEQISLTFTHEVWDEILSEGEKFFPGKQIVGWYHTHPAFGIFLSDYDQFIQQNFFKSPGQFALVLDPIIGKMGWFENKGKKVVLIGEEAMSSGPHAKPSKNTNGKKSTAPLIFTGLISAIITGGVSTGLVLASTPPNLSAALAEEKIYSQSLADELSLAQGQLGYINGSLVLNYRIQDGDTYESIAQTFFGNKEQAASIAEYNELDSEVAPTAGTLIQIVAPSEVSLPAFAPINESQSPSPSPSAEGTESPSPSPTTSD